MNASMSDLNLFIPALQSLKPSYAAQELYLCCCVYIADPHTRRYGGLAAEQF